MATPICETVNPDVDGFMSHDPLLERYQYFTSILVQSRNTKVSFTWPNCTVLVEAAYITLKGHLFTALTLPIF